jgi:hypothetical protein
LLDLAPGLPVIERCVSPDAADAVHQILTYNDSDRVILNDDEYEVDESEFDQHIPPGLQGIFRMLTSNGGMTFLQAFNMLSNFTGTGFVDDNDDENDDGDDDDDDDNDDEDYALEDYGDDDEEGHDVTVDDDSSNGES